MIFFKKSTDRLGELEAMIERNSQTKPVPYGIPYLDDALSGIYPEDLILITARTGGGKTEVATNIAYNAAAIGKQVYYFALEAHQSEIESRIKYRLMTTFFYNDGLHRTTKERPDYQDWVGGFQNHLLASSAVKADLLMNEKLQTLHTHYSDHEFNIEQFEAMMGIVGEDCDLVILDHIHHMDLSGGNENEALKRTIRQIKKVISHYHKPMILIAQMRKGDRYSEQLMPSVDDLHGASELSKIATRIIATAPAREIEASEKTLIPTYVRVLKNRLSSARTLYTALCNYDISKNAYEPGYLLGVLRKDETKFETIEPWHYPKWARPVQGSLL